MTTDVTTLDDLNHRLAMLDSAIDFLRGADADTPGLWYVLDKIAADVDAIIDPVQQLIAQAVRKRGRPKRKAAA